MVSQLYSKVTYLAPLEYLINSDIVEYDISKANINILYSKGAISQSQYQYFLNLPKRDREIQVGIMQRDNKGLVEVLKNGMIEYKKAFFETNDIQDYQVLSIKNDAVFLINKVPTQTKFGIVEFARKDSYTSFYRLGRLELYYDYDYFSRKEYLEVKGMGDDKLALHENYFVEFLKVLFNSAQQDAITETIDLLKDFNDDYINYRLELGFYREFNAQSLFCLKLIPGTTRVFKAQHFPEKDKMYLDISYNQSLLRQLHKVYTGIYFG